MSLDRLQSKPGSFQVNAEPGYTVASSLSSVGSNQLPGGYDFGGQIKIAPARTGSLGGGAIVVNPYPRGVSSTLQGFATTGMITHDNAPVLLLSVSTTGVALNMEQAQYNGQMLTLVAIPGTTWSIVSTLATSGVGAGSSTTYAVPVMDKVYTCASIGRSVFMGLAYLGQGTVTTGSPVVWTQIL